VRGTDDSLSRPLGTYEQVSVKPGERVVSICTGGAGYGLPSERDPERVAGDVQRGWLSKQRARDKYRVVLSDSGTVDLAQTEAVRAKCKSAC